MSDFNEKICKLYHGIRAEIQLISGQIATMKGKLEVLEDVSERLEKIYPDIDKDFA